MLIATIPPPHMYAAGEISSITSAIDGFRFNTGVAVPDPPRKVLVDLLRLVSKRDLWVDLKCRQLRIVKWADPNYSEIELNREVEVKLPAEICFRGERHKSQIARVEGKKIFLADAPQYCVGKGQSVNILSEELVVKGDLFTELDQEYLFACSQLGVDKIMCSFIETWADVTEAATAFPGHIYFKIESEKGVRLVSDAPSTEGMGLELARDDLFIELRNDPKRILSITKEIIRRDPKALAASRLFTGLQELGEPTLSDVTDLTYLLTLGYRNFLFQDGLNHPVRLRKAIECFWRCWEWVISEQHS